MCYVSENAGSQEKMPLPKLPVAAFCTAGIFTRKLDSIEQGNLQF